MPARTFLARYLVGAPTMGSAEGGHPDLFRFPRFLPICSDLHSLFSGIPRFVPICSDLFSEQIRTNQGNPFLTTPFASPRLGCCFDTPSGWNLESGFSQFWSILVDFSLVFTQLYQQPLRQTKPKKRPKRKVHEFRPFFSWILVLFLRLRKTSAIHIELLFRNAPVRSSWTDLSLAWFAGATPDFSQI